MLQKRDRIASYSRIQAEVIQLWQELDADPPTQALACAKLCIDQAPHLAEWLERFILSKLPDALFKKLLFQSPNDGRIQALSLLAECKHSHKKAKTVAQVVPTPEQRRPSIRRRPIITPPTQEFVFHALFGVTLTIQQPIKAIRVDCELGRLTIKASCASEFRLWVIGRDVTRQESGSGRIEKGQLWTRLQAYKLNYTKRHFNRLLEAGNGLFWRLVGDLIYLNGYQRLACLMVQMDGEYEDGHRRNLPGVRDVYLDPSKSLEDWEAMLYAGWLAIRGYKHDPTIARETLSQLFGRHQNTIRKWETHLERVLTKRFNIAQCPEFERYTDHIPLHAQAYATQVRFNGQLIKDVRFYWQLPNTYHSVIPFHPHRGQSSKVRRAVNAEFPAEKKHGGFGLRYLLSPDALKRRFRSFKFRMGQYGDTNQPVYVYLGDHRRSKRGVFEINNSGFVMTYPNERLIPQLERLHFAQHPPKQTELLAYWREQAKDAGLETAKLGHFLEGQ